MNSLKIKYAASLAIFSSIALAAASTSAATITFSNSDFGINTVYSSVSTFAFSIEIQGGLVAGSSYNNPALAGVDYSVFGTLAAGTPSGFSGFNLVRNIGGAEFYTQGSSLNFAIDAGADLSDGLQFDELSGSGAVFVFNGRELGTGRYHPSLLELNSDGTGLLRNSNNNGGINPGSGQVVAVEIGQEYITELTFNPATFTLASASAVVPIPAAALLFGSSLILLRTIVRSTALRGV
ncbi:MAG: hypothetical protein WBN40_05635 [Pseudomonadales bacterium]